MTKSPLVDVVDVAVDMLKEALPGFEHYITNDRQKIRIRGALPIGMESDIQSLYWPVFDPNNLTPLGYWIRDITETDEERAIREAAEILAQTERYRRYLAPYIKELTKRIQNFGIEALNLEPEIEERLQGARLAGLVQGKSEGYAAGKAAGRLEMIQEIISTLQVKDIDHILNVRREELYDADSTL